MLCSLHLPGEGLDAEGGAAGAAVEGGGPPLPHEPAAEAAAPLSPVMGAAEAAAEAAAANAITTGCTKCRYILKGCTECRTHAACFAKGFYFGPDMEVYRDGS